MNLQTALSVKTEWFNDIISILKQDEHLFNIGALPKEKQDFYDACIKEDINKVLISSINMSTKALTQIIIRNYIGEVSRLNALPLLMGFSMGNNEILVWAEIKDDDDQTEINLFKAEAEANAKNINIGINISTTIVEKSDKIQMPSHYIKIFPNA